MQKDYWFTGNTYEELSQAIQKKNATILARLPGANKKLGHVFELGCGTGNLTEEIVQSDRVDCIHALDISKSMIAVAKAKCSLKTVDFFCMPFADFNPVTRYEVFFSNAAFHWLYPQYSQSLEKIENMLSDEGYAYIATAGKNANSEIFDDFIDAKLAKTFANSNYRSFSERRLTSDDFEKLSQSTSLSIQDSFIVERWVRIKTISYIDWLISSGVFWEFKSDELPRVKKLLIENLATSNENDYIKIGHWSLFVVLKKG